MKRLLVMLTLVILASLPATAFAQSPYPYYSTPTPPAPTATPTPYSSTLFWGPIETAVANWLTPTPTPRPALPGTYYPACTWLLTSSEAVEIFMSDPDKVLVMQLQDWAYPGGKIICCFEPHRPSQTFYGVVQWDSRLSTNPPPLPHDPASGEPAYIAAGGLSPYAWKVANAIYKYWMTSPHATQQEQWAVSQIVNPFKLWWQALVRKLKSCATKAAAQAVIDAEMTDATWQANNPGMHQAVGRAKQGALITAQAALDVMQ